MSIFRWPVFGADKNATENLAPEVEHAQETTPETQPIVPNDVANTIKELIDIREAMDELRKKKYALETQLTQSNYIMDIIRSVKWEPQYFDNNMTVVDRDEEKAFAEKINKIDELGNFSYPEYNMRFSFDYTLGGYCLRFNDQESMLRFIKDNKLEIDLSEFRGQMEDLTKRTTRIAVVCSELAEYEVKE